jgi:hypothetical protein
MDGFVDETGVQDCFDFESCRMAVTRYQAQVITQEAPL